MSKLTTEEMRQELVGIINRGLHINGVTVRTIDVLDNASRETLIKTLSYISEYLREHPYK